MAHERREKFLPAALALAVVLFGGVVGLGLWLVGQEAQTQERVEVIERRLVPVCAEPKSKACRAALATAIAGITPKQAQRITRKAKRYRQVKRRERRQERRRRGGGASSTPSASSQPAPGPPAPRAVPTPTAPPRLGVRPPRSTPKPAGPGKSTSQGQACSRGNAKFCR